MRHYHHLTISERESLWELRIKGASIRQIAAKLNRSPSTIQRELERNQKKYSPAAAQEAYRKRRRRCRRKCRLAEGSIREDVLRLLTQEQWSPEQISRRLALEGKPTIHYATIYRALKRGLLEPAGTKKNRHGHWPMQKHLRRKGHKRKERGGNNTTKRKQNFITATIDERPLAADLRSECGHWEGDTVYCSQYQCSIITLVDRCSRYLLTGLAYSKRPAEIAEVLIRMLTPLPPHMVKSITLDRGPEFSRHSLVTEKLPHVKFFFARPHSPWDRGTNENTNGLLRQYVPKNARMPMLDAAFLAEITRKLNSRPRKILDWHSPDQLFSSYFLLHFT